MKDKRIIISFGIIAVLFLYLIFHDQNKKSMDLPELEALKNIDEILIKNEYNAIKIHIKENKWVLNEQAFPADEKKVEKLNKLIKELEVTDLISKGSHYEKFDLNPEKSIKVTVKNEGKILRDILIGKKSSTYRNTYIKFADKEEVYLVSGNLTDEYNKEVKDLREIQIYKIDEKAVNSFDLTYKGKKLSFRKIVEEKEVEVKEEKKLPVNKDVNAKDKKEEKKKTEQVEKWICEQAKNINLDKNKVEAIVKEFSAVKANSFLGTDKKSIKGLLCSIKSKVYEKDIELSIHKEDAEGNFICASSESPYIFTLKDWNVKKFFKDLSDLKEDPKKK